MPLNVACPSCQTRYSLPEKFAGKKLKCKSCGKPFLANASKPNAAAAPVATRKTVPSGDPAVEAELAKMGLGTLRKQPELFPSAPAPGPDPLRNHVVQDPGFGDSIAPIAGTAAGLAAAAAAKEVIQVDDDDQAVTVNPFMAPKPVAKSRPEGQSGKGKSRNAPPASLGKRFLGFLIDSILLSGINLGTIIGLTILLALMGMDFESNFIVLNLILNAVGVLIFFGYYVLQESLFASTIGKLIVGTKVIDVDGSKASFGKIMLRSLCRLIPFEALTFLMGPDKGWHDTLSGTRVIDAR